MADGCCGVVAGPESGRISSQSLRSVARGSMGLAPADPLLRQNEEVLLVSPPCPACPLSQECRHVRHLWHAYQLRVPQISVQQSYGSQPHCLLLPMNKVCCL